MKIERTGLILYVIKYDECVVFYKEVLNLNILFQNDDLTCFDFFGTYLMVEKEDRNEFLNSDIGAPENFCCLRMNVDNVNEFSEQLKAKGVVVNYQEHSWGTIAKFKDPNGNLIAFKDEKGFEKQIEEYKNNE
ncbi:MAG: glyoxalase [Kordia sp.]|nr:MAG: glyoxalase [Kordia sp.]